ncbi:hypothetical protein QJQ45_016793 [Haematococcus lacustris]|nr:hypothetical protein QJQ45_016793 [Haematococcus lacustris]
MLHLRPFRAHHPSSPARSQLHSLRRCPAAVALLQPGRTSGSILLPGHGYPVWAGCWRRYHGVSVADTSRQTFPRLSTMMMSRASNSGIALARRVFVAAPRARLSTVKVAAAYGAQGVKIYVGNLSWESTNEDVAEHFGTFGTVVDCNVVMDRETGRSRGFAFVTMSDGAEEAIAELNESEFMSRNIRVRQAEERERPAPGGPCLSMQRGLRVVAAMVAVVVTMAVVVGAAMVVAAGATVVAEGAMVAAVAVAVAMAGSGQATKRGASGSGQQDQGQGQGQAVKVVIAERRQVIKAALRGLVEAAQPDLSPAEVDAVVAEVNKRVTMGSKQCVLAAVLCLSVLLQSFLAPPPQAPPGGRWLDRDTNGCLNLQRIGESRQRPIELCQWDDLEALPPIGEDQQGYKRVNDRLPKGKQWLHRAAEYRRGIDVGWTDCACHVIGLGPQIGYPQQARSSSGWCAQPGASGMLSTPPAAPGPMPRPQAPPWGRWLDWDTNSCLNFQRIGESMQRPLDSRLEMCLERSTPGPGCTRPRPRLHHRPFWKCPLNAGTHTPPGKQREERRLNGKPNDDSGKVDCNWLQVIKVPGGAVLRGCKKTKRKLMAHFQLRAGVHSQLRMIASSYVLRILLTCLVGYSTPGFRSALTPPPASHVHHLLLLAARADIWHIAQPSRADIWHIAHVHHLLLLTSFLSHPTLIFTSIFTSTSFFTSTSNFHYTSTSFFTSISTSIFTSFSIFTSTSFFTYTCLFTYSPPPTATYTPISISTLTLIFDLDARCVTTTTTPPAVQPPRAQDAAPLPPLPLRTPAQPASMAMDWDPGPEPEPEPEPEPAPAPPTLRPPSARLAARHPPPAAPTGPPMPLDSEDPVMRQQLQVFCDYLEREREMEFLPLTGEEYPSLPRLHHRHPGSQMMADQLRRWKLTKGQVKHASGLNNARRDTERWLAPIKPHLMHLAAASSAGTSLEVNLKHITVTLATWDAVWEVHPDPKWAQQRLRLYGAQDRTLEQFFKKFEEDMEEVSMQRHGRAKPRGTDQRRGRVVLVDEHRTSRVSSAVNGQQPCERELNKHRAARPAHWKPPTGQVEQRLVRPAWSQQRDQPVRGMMWCPVVAPRKPPQAPRSSQEATQAAASEPGPSTPLPAKRSKRTKAEPAAEPTKGKGKGKAAKAKPAPQPGRRLDRDCNAALNMQRNGESRWRPLELCYWPEHGKLPAKGKEYPGLGYKRLRDKPPKAQQQQPAEAQ